MSVHDDRVVLRSRRLGREVIPRLTTAHNYVAGGVALYRFLCALQHQDTLSGLGWDWGPLAGAPFLPRVVSGRVVLSRARWNLDRSEVQRLGQLRSPEDFAGVQEWRGRRGLPRYAALADDDHELVVDFDNLLSLEALAHQLRGRQEATLVEMFPGPGELWVSGPEGRFVHEIVVPFVKSGTSEETPTAAPPPGIATGSVRRRFPPGSEWLYAKLYTGPATADDVLTRLAAPVVRSALGSGAADSWFFIRYADPHGHLRLRLHGPPERLHHEVLPHLQKAADPFLDDGSVWRLQLDTYEREVERYGGAAGVFIRPDEWWREVFEFWSAR